MNSVFTDEEHRILLAALEREKQVCREYDQEHDSENKLAPIVKRIERKVYDLQNQDADLKRHFLAAEEPEWDPENRFHRCPSCRRRIHEYHGFCKHCGKKIDWQPLMKKRKKEAEIRGQKEGRKKAR